MGPRAQGPRDHGPMGPWALGPLGPSMMLLRCVRSIRFLHRCDPFAISVWRWTSTYQVRPSEIKKSPLGRDVRQLALLALKMLVPGSTMLATSIVLVLGIAFIFFWLVFFFYDANTMLGFSGHGMFTMLLQCKCLCWHSIVVAFWARLWGPQCYFCLLHGARNATTMLVLRAGNSTMLL